VPAGGDPDHAAALDGGAGPRGVRVRVAGGPPAAARGDDRRARGDRGGAVLPGRAAVAGAASRGADRRGGGPHAPRAHLPARGPRQGPDPRSPRCRALGRGRAAGARGRPQHAPLRVPRGRGRHLARTRSGHLRGGRVEIGERHDAAELLLLRGLPGWSDAFRAVHGHARRDRSWRAPWGESYRLDHVVCSPELTATACDYLHPWREDGLSDHAGMWAEIVPVR